MRTIALLLSFLVFGGCESDPIPTGTSGSEPALEIRTGTSFGECFGYCFTELRLRDGAVELVRSSTEAAEPELIYRAVMDPAEWAELRDVASPKLLEGVPAVLGCPDCNDGGAEWVALKSTTATREVTFEAGTDVEALKEVLPVLRQLRARYQEEASFGPIDPDADLVIQTGTSFGMCSGYCITSLTLQNAEVELRRRAWRVEEPDLVYRTTMDRGEWAELRARVRPGLLDAVPQILGCPDCADGGAEWITIDHRGTRDFVKFDYEAEVAALGDALPFLRELRRRYLAEAGF